MKFEQFSATSKNTVSYDEMEMGVKIKSGTESLDKRDCSNLSIRGGWGASDQLLPNLPDNYSKNILKNGLCF
jgi:hypothetical protein